MHLFILVAPGRCKRSYHAWHHPVEPDARMHIIINNTNKNTATHSHIRCGSHLSHVIFIHSIIPNKYIVGCLSLSQMVAHFARDYTKIWKCAAIFSAKILLMSPVIAQHECLRACARCAVRSVRHRALGHNFSLCCFFLVLQWPIFEREIFTWNQDSYVACACLAYQQQTHWSVWWITIIIIKQQKHYQRRLIVVELILFIRANRMERRGIFFFLATPPIFSSASWSRECKWRETHQWGWLNVCHHFRILPDIARINIKMYIFSLYI